MTCRDDSVVKTVYVEGISYDASEEDIKEFFEGRVSISMHTSIDADVSKAFYPRDLTLLFLSFS